MSQNLSALWEALLPTSWGGATKKIGNINVDPNGSLIVSGQGGSNNALYLNGSTPLIVKPGPGMVCTAIVQVAGSGTGAIYDCTATANAVTATQVAVIPETVGPIDLNFPCLTGIVVKLGTSQVISLSYQ
jgi:hypothetical protein